MLVWRLDRWGRSVDDLMLTLKELNELGREPKLKNCLAKVSAKPRLHVA